MDYLEECDLKYNRALQGLKHVLIDHVHVFLIRGNNGKNNVTIIDFMKNENVKKRHRRYLLVSHRMKNGGVDITNKKFYENKKKALKGYKQLLNAKNPESVVL